MWFILKYYITVSFRQFTKTLNHFLYLSRVRENCLIWVIERTIGILRYFHWMILNKWTLSQKCKISFSFKTATFSNTIFTWILSAMKQLLENFDFEHFQFFLHLKIKKLLSVKFCDVLTYLRWLTLYEKWWQLCTRKC